MKANKNRKRNDSFSWADYLHYNPGSPQYSVPLAVSVKSKGNVSNWASLAWLE